MANNPTEPVRGPEAFAEESTAASMSRAAVLLGISANLDQPREARLMVLRDREVEPFDAFEIPPVPNTGERFRMDRRLSIVLIQGEPFQEEIRANLARTVFANAEPLDAALLADYCLGDPDPLTRVAAAVLHFRLAVDPGPAVETLAEGTRSGDELVRDVAATALARISPRHPALDRLRQRAEIDGSPPRATSQTSMLIHGTWARNTSWWQPGGDFHAHLKAGYRKDLYSESDRFEWSGGYSPGARAAAAVDLNQWIIDHDEEDLDLIAHSHGSNVAFRASWSSPRLGDVISLSCPVHDEYVPNFANIRRVVSVRVKFDLVILVDGGRQRFDDPRIKEIVLPLWFNHSATLDPEVWEEHHVAALIEA